MAPRYFLGTPAPSLIAIALASPDLPSPLFALEVVKQNFDIDIFGDHCLAGHLCKPCGI